MVLRLGVFLAVGSTAYLTLAVAFWAVCVMLGHNTMEMLYGGTAVYLFTLAFAVEGAWFLPEAIKSSSAFVKLTQRSPSADA